MRRLSLTELLKTSAAFTVVSASVVDAGLLLADNTGLVDVPTSWYYNAPLGAWVVVGVPTTITLAERLLRHVDPNPGQIRGYQENTPSPLLSLIGLKFGGKSAGLIAHTVPFLFEQQVKDAPGNTVYRPAAWRVPVNHNPVVVRESELRAFLDVAIKRDKYQFSRPYWTKRRRPPLDRGKYEAFMRLLTESGLVEGRHPTGGASGRLITHPRHAITYLKYESVYAVTR
jgi:hypothetical protein